MEIVIMTNVATDVGLLINSEVKLRLALNNTDLVNTEAKNIFIRSAKGLFLIKKGAYVEMKLFSDALWVQDATHRNGFLGFLISES